MTRIRAKRGAPGRCSSKGGSGLTYNYFTKLDRLARDKRSSLFGLAVISVSHKTLLLTMGANELWPVL
jgi:hypothetical protein